MADQPAAEPTTEALREARRHIAAAEAHERKVAQWEEQATFVDERSEHERAEAMRREANLERDAARDEWDRAEALQGPTQKTQPKKGKPVEIPVPTRDAFLRDIEKVAPRPSKK